MPSVTLPGAVRQIGYVVRDLDQTLAAWLALGVGPWFVLRGHQQTGLYRGEPCTVTQSIAFANTGDMQIELIHQDDQTASIYTEFLAAGHEGFHQLGWWTDDFDATIAAVKAAGWPIVWTGGEDGKTRYAYLEPPAGPAPIVELMEVNDSTEALGKLVREAAEGWDGTEPIRPLGASARTAERAGS